MLDRQSQKNRRGVMAKGWGCWGPDGMGAVRPRESEESCWRPVRLKLVSVPGWPGKTASELGQVKPR